MSPILVRPVREQLEHDRMIRLLQAKFRRRYDAGINPGAEQNVPVGTGPRRFIRIWCFCPPIAAANSRPWSRSRPASR